MILGRFREVLKVPILANFVIIPVMTNNSDINLDDLYQHTIKQLELGLRPVKLYNQQEGQQLFNHLKSLVDSPSPDEIEIKKILCLLEHAQCHGIDFSILLIELLKKKLSNDCQIFIISVSIKWIVEYQQKLGFPLRQDFVNLIVEILLSSKDFELIEWILRLIESTGNQSLKFKQSIVEKRFFIKPKFLRRTGIHQQNCFQLILLIESRWEKIYGKLKK